MLTTRGKSAICSCLSVACIAQEDGRSPSSQPPVQIGAGTVRSGPHPSRHYGLAGQGIIGDNEWFRPRANRLQHGFTFDARPPYTGPLTIDVTVSGIDGVPHRTERGITWMDGRRVVATYYDLYAWDATGRDLPAHMQLRCQGDPALGDCQVRLQVDDAGARYPVVVDPFLTVAEIPDVFYSGAGNTWSEESYFFHPDAVTLETRVWEIVGDAPVDRGTLPCRLCEPWHIGAQDGRFVLITDDEQIEEWGIDPTTGQLAYVGPMPLPDQIYTYTDIGASAVAWTAEGPLVIAGPSFTLNGNENLYLLSDASGTWAIDASSIAFTWGVPTYQDDVFATAVDGEFRLLNYNTFSRRATLRKAVRNGSSLDIVDDIDPNNPGTAYAGYLAVADERVLWGHFGYPAYVLTDGSGQRSEPDFDAGISLRDAAMSPSGEWLAVNRSGVSVDLYHVDDALQIEHIEEIPLTQPASDVLWAPTFLQESPRSVCRKVTRSRTCTT